MRKANIMHIRDSNGIYGAERVILALGKHINRRLFNFTLLCMKHPDGKSEQLTSKAKDFDIPVLTLDVKGRVDLDAVSRIREILIQNSISLFHSHDYKSDFYGLLASANLGIMRVATAHGSTRDSFLKRLYLFLDERITYKFFDKIIAVSEDLRTQLIQKNINSKKIAVIQNGLDISMLEKESSEITPEHHLPIPDGKKLFAVIGRLYPDKGHRFFLQAFSKVCRNHSSIAGLIIGEGPSIKEITQQIRDLKLEDSVFLFGFRSDMKNIYSHIDFLVIPSLTEGLPYVLLEAMASGIPVIASAVGDIPILVNDAVTGYLVSPGDVDALEKRMIDFLTLPEKAKEMAEKGYSLVKKGYSAEMMVKKTEETYVSLLNS